MDEPESEHAGFRPRVDPGAEAPGLHSRDSGLRTADRGPILLVGSEGEGLSAEARLAADVEARIPMANDVDSLNVAVATAVAVYALSRRKL